MPRNAIAFQVLKSPDDLLEQLTDLAAAVDFLIVDGPAGLSEATRAILIRADFAVVPVQPSGIDVQFAATEAMDLLEKFAPTIKMLKSVIHQNQAIAPYQGCLRERSARFL